MGKGQTEVDGRLAYVVVVENGQYSEFYYAVDSVHPTEESALCRIVNDLHGTLSDEHSKGHLAWEFDYGRALGTWSGRTNFSRPGRVDCSPDAPWWWREMDWNGWHPFIYTIRTIPLEG